jgi:hypothetical protein
MPATRDDELTCGTLALLDEVAVPVPAFGDVDADVFFGTPLELYEDVLPRERLPSNGDLMVAIEAIHARDARLAAAADILADDPTITTQVRECLVDLLLPHAADLAIEHPARHGAPHGLRLHNGLSGSGKSPAPLSALLSSLAS